MSRRGAAHPVTLQFSVKYAMPKNRKRKMTRKVIEEAIKWWIDEGEAPDGFEITPIHWQHGDRITEATDEEAFRNIMGRLLQAGASVRFTLGNHERIL